jgi:hypothetical protein
MHRKWWFWVVFAFGLSNMLRIAIRAFSAPWRMADQAFFIFCALCLALALGRWAFVWWRGGTAAVRASWNQSGQISDTPGDKKIFR